MESRARSPNKRKTEGSIQQNVPSENKICDYKLIHNKLYKKNEKVNR